MSSNAKWEQLQRVIRIVHNRQVRNFYNNKDAKQGTGRSTVQTALLIDDKDSQMTVLNKQLLFRLVVQGIDSGEAILALPDNWGVKPGRDRPVLLLIYKEKRGQKWGLSTFCTSIWHPELSSVKEILERGKKPKDRTGGRFFAYRSLKDGSKLQAYGSSEREATEYLTYMESLVRTGMMDARFKVIKGEYPGLETRILKIRKAAYYAKGQANNVKPTAERYFN